MIRRPWKIVLLAGLHLLAPITVIFLSSILTGIVQKPNGSEQVLSLLVLPIAGVAIYAIKDWSPPVFFSAIVINILFNLDAWRSDPASLSAWIVFPLNVLNLIVVGYLLLGEVREPYRNPRLRWWEQKPRYRVELPGRIFRFQNRLETSCQIIDLSETGALVGCGAEFAVGDQLDIRISCRGLTAEARAEVVRLAGRSPDGVNGYGVQFQFSSKTERRVIHQLIREVQKFGQSGRGKIAETRQAA